MVFSFHHRHIIWGLTKSSMIKNEGYEKILITKVTFDNKKILGIIKRILQVDKMCYKKIKYDYFYI